MERTVRYHVELSGQSHIVEFIERQGGLAVVMDGQTVPLDVQRVDHASLFSILAGGASIEAVACRLDDRLALVVDGDTVVASVRDEREMRLAQLAGPGHRANTQQVVKAPMPGLVVAVHVEPGQTVARARGLLVLEAMKMENEILAPDSGTIKEVRVAPGQTVDHGQVLVVMESTTG